MFQAIILDMDGLMIDTEKFYMEHFSKQLKTIGVELSIPIFIGQMGMNTDDEAQYIIKQYKLDMSVNEMKNILKTSKIQDDIINGNIELEPMPGLFEFLNTFSKILKYGIASGSSLKMINYTIQKLQLESFIQAVASSEEVPLGKPNPDVYLKAAERLDADISKCIVLEDAPKGVIAGKNAGAYVIAIPNEWTKGFDFSHADQVCSSLSEAIGAINKLFR